MDRVLNFGSGGGGVAIAADSVAFSSRSDVVTSFFNSSFTNTLTNLDDNIEINAPESDTFSVNDGGDRVIIPEDGNYRVVFSVHASASNSGNNSRFLINTQLQHDRDGTTTMFGGEGSDYSRGEYNADLQLASAQSEGMIALLEGDEIWGELRAYRQNSSNTASIEAEISILKLQGVAGEKGDKGDTGDTGDTGGMGSLPDTSAEDAGRVLTVNDDGDDVEWADAPDGITNLAVSGRDADSLDITSSTGTNATVPMANFTQAGLMTSVQNNKLASIDDNADVNVQSDWDATTGDALILNKPTTITSAQAMKLAGIEASADVNVGTNLTHTQSANVVQIHSSTGTDTSIPTASSSVAGVLTATDKTKLDGIATGAEVNVRSVTSTT